ncbi:cache domain-containing sensor histidine kinase [Paenibacillus ferrarius]|uniref:cache domain-containing sensor histidine kinase n=1 Tax=Paenibacillus ferrarius TaxID=1469647 RepID=UPI003D2CDBC9
MSIWNPVKQFRIDVVLLSCFAGIIIIFLSIFGWFSYRISSNELMKNISVYQMRLLHEFTNKIDTYLLGIEQSSIALTRNFNTSYSQMPFASSTYAKDRLRADSISEIEHFVNSNGSVDSVELYLDDPLYYDKMLHVYFFDNHQLQQELWYEGIAHADAGWIPEHFIHTVRGDINVVSFTRKINNNAGKAYGLLVINVKVDYLNSLIKGDKEGARILIDSGGRTVTSTENFHFEINKLLNGLDLDSNVNSFYKIVKTKEMENKELFVWSKMLNSNWILYEVTPWNEINTSGAKIAKTLLVIGSISLMLILLATIFISNQFVKPIKILLRKMSAFPQETHIQKLNMPTDYRNEFGLLFQGYAKLMLRIDDLYESLEKQHEQKREAEIRALQVMINPHFLYNSLDQINWMAIDAGQKNISEMLSLLANMYRVGFSKGSVYIKLKEELFYLEGYLKFQKVHWENRLTYQIHVQDDLEQCLIPRLSLQPFIENCFIHAFHKRKQGDIIVQVKQVSNIIEILIADDGRGLQASANSNKNRELGGYGILNVQERYRALFGEGFGYELKSRDSGGTVAIIRLPKLFN